ncbi:hypothetical protein M1247_32080 [Mycobacterium sp. 21AC1]|uniref:hypothetical protein n=1 Tax=[Mycobacterium] appelbergii TaxID=2939269 RepID=UPI0029391FA4|nr:hypothetical protein [Mycobacterium sp. 21AC1]MDV3129582.1 hypothetical protein [Mycobacterium sp. 21AC1]
MGRHRVASSRRKSSAVMAGLIAPAAVLFAAGGTGYSPPAKDVAAPAPEGAAPSGMEMVAKPPAPAQPPRPAPESGMKVVTPHVIAASRWRVIDIPKLLPVGIAPERGLQVKTILAARSISADFPEIHSIGGVRPDSLRWHPNGLALDVMIPNPSSAAGIALGDEIVAYAFKNAKRFGLQDCIWRGTYYTPDGGARSGGYGHYDHVHITTKGGGYPTGGETYLR